MKKIVPIVFLTTIFLVACNVGKTPNSPIDEQIYKDAINSNNSKLCNTISDQKLKEECKITIQDIAKKFEAINKSDLSLCNGINNKQLQESCTIQIQTALDQKNKLNSLFEDRTNLTEEAIKKNDTDICKGIDDENFQNECILSTLTDPGYKGKDKVECEQITNETLKEVCLADPKRTD